MCVSAASEAVASPSQSRHTEPPADEEIIAVVHTAALLPGDIQPDPSGQKKEGELIVENLKGGNSVTPLDVEKINVGPPEAAIPAVPADSEEINVGNKASGVADSGINIADCGETVVASDLDKDGEKKSEIMGGEEVVTTCANIVQEMVNNSMLSPLPSQARQGSD